MGALIAELYNEVLNTMFSVLEEASEGTYPVSKADEIKALSVPLTYMADNRDLFCTLYSHDESSLFVRHMTQYCIKKFNLEEKCLFDRYACLYSAVGSFTVSRQWLEENCPCKAEELAELISLQSHFICTTKGAEKWPSIKRR